MSTFTILAWVIITIFSFIIMPFFTIAIIFYGAHMPVLSILSVLLGTVHMIYRVGKIIDY